MAKLAYLSPFLFSSSLSIAGIALAVVSELWQLLSVLSVLETLARSSAPPSSSCRVFRRTRNVFEPLLHLAITPLVSQSGAQAPVGCVREGAFSKLRAAEGTK